MYSTYYFIWFKRPILLTCLGTAPFILNLTRNSPSFPVGDPLGNGLSGVAPTAINRKLQITRLDIFKKVTLTSYGTIA